MQTALSPTSSAPFWDKIAPKYAKQPVKDPVAYEEKLARVRELLQPEDRVLEIGCGTGSTALRLAASVASITATDISQQMIAIAERKRFEARTQNILFQRAAAGDRLDDGPFDVVTAFSMLHLVDDVPAILKAVYAQTKPGGLFISKTVCLGDAFVGLRLFVRALRVLGVAPSVTMLSKAELRQMMVTAGFNVLESRYFGKSRFNPFIVAQRPH